VGVEDAISEVLAERRAFRLEFWDGAGLELPLFLCDRPGTGEFSLFLMTRFGGLAGFAGDFRLLASGFPDDWGLLDVAEPASLVDPEMMEDLLFGVELCLSLAE